MPIADQLGQFVTDFSVVDLPQQATEHAAMVIASTIASAALGKDLSPARSIRALVCDRGGRPEASLWFHDGPKLPIAEAAQANTVMSGAAGSDDSDLRDVGHFGTSLTTATLAVAEQNKATGAEVLAAIVLGYEVAGRVRDAMPDCRRDLDRRLGVTAATGRLLRLDHTQMARAIMLSAISMSDASSPSASRTTSEAPAGGATLGLGIGAGISTRLGIQAAIAATRDEVTETELVESSSASADLISQLQSIEAGEIATRDLGKSWDIMTDLAIKLVPGAQYNHALGEAAANAARDGDFDADDVESILIWLQGRDGGPAHPTTFDEMAYSSRYFAAAGVVDRDFSWIHASKEKYTDPSINRLIDMVEFNDPPPPDEIGRFRRGAIVTIRTRDGRTSTSTVYSPRGTASLGLHWQDIDTKYRALVPASGLPQEQIDASLAVTHQLSQLADVSALTELLHVNGANRAFD